MTQCSPIGDADRQTLDKMAEKLFWWKTPAEALRHTSRFLAQVMTLGTWKDVKAVRRIFGDERLREVLSHPPAGVFDALSWSYWHVVFELPVPPLPKRRFE